MLNLDSLRERVYERFRPFTLCLTDGRRFYIPRPDFIAIGRSGVVVIDDRDVVHIIDALHIVSIEEPFAMTA